MLIDTPLIQELRAEFKQEERVNTLLEVLQTRFGTVTPYIAAGLAQVKEQEKLVRLTQQVVTCATLQAFEDALRKELPAPPPASTRGKQRSRKPS